MTEERARPGRALIKEAVLASASGDFIYRFYVDQSKVNQDHQCDDVDEQTEKRLLDRNDPFIDLTLAQYCLHSETLGALFGKSRTNKNLALALACVSNITVSRQRYAFCKMPEALFPKRSKESVTAWFKVIGNDELDAFFRNPTIEDHFLADVLEGKHFWAEMTDDQKRTILLALCNNPRICAPYDNEYMDGYAEYSHSRIANSIWHLAAILPVERQWAAILGALFEKTVGGSHDLDMLQLAKRWNVADPAEQAEKKKQFLTPFEAVRYALYKESGKISEPRGKNAAEARKPHLENDDIAYRAAIYSQFSLSPEEIAGAYERDALLAFQYIVNNIHVWRNAKSRKAFRDICWDADGKYNNNYLDCANHFNWKEKELQGKHPDWFVERQQDVEGDAAQNDQQAFLSKMFEIDGKLDMDTDKTDQILAVAMVTKQFVEEMDNKHAKQLESIQKLLKSTINKLGAIGWIFWILVALFVYEVYRQR